VQCDGSDCKKINHNAVDSFTSKPTGGKAGDSTVVFTHGPRGQIDRSVRFIAPRTRGPSIDECRACQSEPTAVWPDHVFCEIARA
jgi:hypothetical protein